MRYWLAGLSSTMMMISSTQPIGLRGRRAASSIPTAVAGTTPAAVLKVGGPARHGLVGEVIQYYGGRVPRSLRSVPWRADLSLLIC